MYPFDYKAFAVTGKVRNPANRFSHTSWAVVNSTNLPKSVCNDKEKRESISNPQSVRVDGTSCVRFTDLHSGTPYKVTRNQV